MVLLISILYQAKTNKDCIGNTSYVAQIMWAL